MVKNYLSVSATVVFVGSLLMLWYHAALVNDDVAGLFAPIAFICFAIVLRAR